MCSAATPTRAGFRPVPRVLPVGVGTNGQVSSWGAQLAGAAPPLAVDVSRG